MTAAEEALKLVYGDRAESYGHPKDDFDRTAKIWSAILGIEITATQVALMMALGVKGSRLINDPLHHDTLVDAIGYLLCMERVQRREAGLE